MEPRALLAPEATEAERARGREVLERAVAGAYTDDWAASIELAADLFRAQAHADPLAFAALTTLGYDPRDADELRRP